jgi:hypothetical protein
LNSILQVRRSLGRPHTINQMTLQAVRHLGHWFDHSDLAFASVSTYELDGSEINAAEGPDFPRSPDPVRP